jgi:hypothetical protein
MPKHTSSLIGHSMATTPWPSQLLVLPLTRRRPPTRSILAAPPSPLVNTDSASVVFVSPDKPCMTDGKSELHQKNRI